MKKFTIALSILAVLGTANLLLTSWQDYGQLESCSNVDPLSKATPGASAGYANDPGNGSKKCTQCHAGPTAATVVDLTTTNIPATGYVPGTTYIITTAKTSTGGKYGFQTAAQGGGIQRGTFANINAVETQIKTRVVGPNTFSYVGHTEIGSAGSGGKSWSYNWTAPAAGAGQVTFYSTFLDTDGGDDTPGDITYISTTVVEENLNVGISQVATKSNMNVFPTVSNGAFTVEVSNFGEYALEVYNLTGVKVFSKTSSATTEKVNLTVPAGLYFVNVKKDNKNSIQKIVIQ